MANLNLLDDLKLIENSRLMGDYFTTGLRDALGDHPNVGDIRGEGLLGAVELVADRDGRVFFEPSAQIGAKVNAALLNRQVISRAMPEGDILGFAPPFCLSKAEADQIIEKLTAAITEVLG